MHNTAMGATHQYGQSKRRQQSLPGSQTSPICVSRGPQKLASGAREWGQERTTLMLGMGLDGWILIEPLLAGGGAARHRVLHLSVRFGKNPVVLAVLCQS